MNIAVLGAQAGDEAKGRITHDFSPNYDWVVRFSGGANAGHTIYRDGNKYVHNLMPSFDWRSARPKAFLGSGMVIDLQQLHNEVYNLHQIDHYFPYRVYVDPEAFLVLPLHKEIDKASNIHIGSTNRGIGPAYKEKIGRTGLRIRDVMLKPQLNLELANLIESMQKMGVTFASSYELRDSFLKEEILFEGAQGLLLDINHGTYPYVSCGDATVAGIYSSGFAHTKLDKVYGVAKCYMTRVGEGPFPTELFGLDAKNLREKGKEYGATTGRPRRVGWLDLPSLYYACQTAGITDLILTKFDVLENMKVSVCYEYDRPLNCPHDFFVASPKYTSFDGWSNSKDLDQLKEFISYVENQVKCKVSYISSGTNTEDLYKL